MTYKEATPTFNVNRTITNFKDFIFNKDQEKEELKKIKKSFTKNDKNVGPSSVKSKYNKVTHKNDHLTKGFIDDSISKLEESVTFSMDSKELNGWCFWDNGMHSVEFTIDSGRLSARADGEIWDLSDDPNDFVDFVDDRVFLSIGNTKSEYTFDEFQKHDRFDGPFYGENILFSNIVALSEWISHHSITSAIY